MGGAKGLLEFDKTLPFTATELVATDLIAEICMEQLPFFVFDISLLF